MAKSCEKATAEAPFGSCQFTSSSQSLSRVRTRQFATWRRWVSFWMAWRNGSLVSPVTSYSPELEAWNLAISGVRRLVRESSRRISIRDQKEGGTTLVFRLLPCQPCKRVNPPWLGA